MIEAVVQTGAFETSYRRAGTGAPVLLLDGGDPEIGEWLFRSLAARFRVVAPARRDGQAGFEAWLRGLIDGLGLDQPAVVAAVADGAALLAFAAIDPLRLRRLALVEGPPGALSRAGALDDAIGAAGHPVLVVPVPTAADSAGRRAAEEALVAFLALP